MPRAVSRFKNRRTQATSDRPLAVSEALSQPDPAVSISADSTPSPAWNLAWIIPMILIAAVVGLRLSGLLPLATTGQPAPDPELVPPAQDVLDVVAFQVSPVQATPGERIRLSWEVSGGAEARFELDPAPNPDARPQCAPTELVVEETTETALPTTTCHLDVPAPDATTTYQLTADAGQRTRSRSVLLEVIAEPPAVLAADAQPATVDSDSAVLLSWLADGDDALVTLEPGDGQAVPPSGSAVRFPPASMRFTVVAANAVGPTIANVDVNVGQDLIPALPLITEFALSRDDREGTGESSAPERITLRWKTSGAERVTLYGRGLGDPFSGLPGLAPEDVLAVAAPSQTTTYHLVAFGKGGAAVQAVDFVADVGELALPDQAGSRQAVGPPEIALFDVAPPSPRLGDEVVVRWVVENASAVDVSMEPEFPGVMPTGTSGIRRFIAAEDTTISLEAIGTGADRAAVRGQITVPVRRLETAPIVQEFGDARPALLAHDEASGVVALATDRGQVWLYDSAWSEVGALGSSPVSLALGGQALYAIDAERRLQHLPLIDDSKRERTFQARAVPDCGRAEAIAVHEPATAEAQGERAILLIACSSPHRLLALSPDDDELGTLAWSLPLPAAPAAIEGPTGDGTTIAVRYHLDGTHGDQIDLIDLPSPDDGCLFLGEAASQATPVAGPAHCEPVVSSLLASGPVVDAAPDRAGASVVVAVRGEAALYVLDVRGLPPREIALAAEVSSLEWVTDRTIDRADGTSDSAISPSENPAPASEAMPPLPRPQEQIADFTPPSSGSVAVTWATGTGGSLVSLAVWASEPHTLSLLPDRRLLGLVDGERALIAAVLDPGSGVAYNWSTIP